MHLYLEPPNEELTKQILATPWVALDTEYGGAQVLDNPSKKKSKKNRLHPDQLRASLVGFSLWYPGCPWPEGAYFPTWKPRESPIQEACHVPEDYCLFWLQGLLGEYKGQIWMHNASADLNVMCNQTNSLPFPKNPCDSMILGWALGKYTPGCQSILKELSLDSCIRKFLAVEGGKSFHDTFQGRTSSEVPPEEMAPYAAKDAWYTGRLVEIWLKELDAMPAPAGGLPSIKEYLYSVEMPLLRVVWDMYREGLPLDSAALTEAVRGLRQQEARLSSEFTELTSTWVELPTKQKVETGELFKNGKPKTKTVEVLEPTYAGASIASGDQIARWLFDELRWWPKDDHPVTASGRPSTSRPDLDRLRPRITDELGKQALELRFKYSAVSKRRSTYLEPFPSYAEKHGTGRIHSSMLQCGTETSRFSSLSPNIMNLPKDGEDPYAEGLPSIKEAVRAPIGYKLICADLSQAELRIMAHISKDENMTKAYKEGLDLHAMTQARVKQDYGHDIGRGKAKGLIFSVLYGSGPWGLAQRLDVEVPEAKQFIEALYRQYPGMKAFHKKIVAYARRHNCVPTLGGYVQRLNYLPGEPQTKEERKHRGHEDRKAKNCFDRETEVLTEHGWMKGWDVPEGVRILTRRPVTGELEWHVPYVWHRWENHMGPMYRFKSRDFDSLTTHNHRWYVWDRKRKVEKVVTSENLVRTHGDVGIIRCGKADTREDPFWELVGWVITDGHYKKGVNTVHVHQTKPSGCKKLESLIELGLLKPPRGNDKWRSYLLPLPLAKQIRVIAPDKRLTPAVVMQCTAPQSLLRGLINGDGYRNAKDKGSYRLVCGDLEQAEAAQMLASLCGMHASIRKRDITGQVFRSPKVQPEGIRPKKPVYVVYFNLRTRAQVLPKYVEVIEDTPHDIWCPEVQNQSLVVRRNGKVYVSGNTPIQGSAAFMVKKAMIDLHRKWEGTEAKILTQVHDEILCMAPEREAERRAEELAYCMENAFPLRVPVVAEAKVGDTWAEIK